MYCINFQEQILMSFKFQLYFQKPCSIFDELKKQWCMYFECIDFWPNILLFRTRNWRITKPKWCFYFLSVLISSWGTFFKKLDRLILSSEIWHYCIYGTRLCAFLTTALPVIICALIISCLGQEPFGSQQLHKHNTQLFIMKIRWILL